MSEWQPIETAPKDGTHILIFVPDHDEGKPLIYVVFWSTKFFKGWLEADGEGYSRYEPTHWMSLPEPPNV